MNTEEVLKKSLVFQVAWRKWDPLKTVKRELLEETGYKGKKWAFIKYTDMVLIIAVKIIYFCKTGQNFKEKIRKYKKNGWI